MQHLTDSTFEHLTQVIDDGDDGGDDDDNYDDDDDDDNDNLRPQLEQPLGIGLSFSSQTSVRLAGSFQVFGPSLSYRSLFRRMEAGFDSLACKLKGRANVAR